MSPKDIFLGPYLSAFLSNPQRSFFIQQMRTNNLTVFSVWEVLENSAQILDALIKPFHSGIRELLTYTEDEVKNYKSEKVGWLLSKGMVSDRYSIIGGYKLTETNGQAMYRCK